MEKLLAHIVGEEALLDHAFGVATHVLLALGILWLGWMIARRTSRLLHSILWKADKLDPTLRPLVVSLVDWGCKILATVLALSQVGVHIAAIAALLGAAGIAIGLALQGTLQNIAAGIMLILLRPFQVGEYIESDGGNGGTVQEIGLFNTRIEKPDGIYLYVPNSKLWGSVITNYSRTDRRRMDLIVKIDYRGDLGTAVRVLHTYLLHHPGVLQDPAPQVVVSGMDNTATELTLRAWTQRSKYWDVRYALNAGLRSELDQAGISLIVPASPALPG